MRPSVGWIPPPGSSPASQRRPTPLTSNSTASRTDPLVSSLGTANPRPRVQGARHLAELQTPGSDSLVPDSVHHPERPGPLRPGFSPFQADRARPHRRSGGDGRNPGGRGEATGGDHPLVQAGSLDSACTRPHVAGRCLPAESPRSHEVESTGGHRKVCPSPPDRSSSNSVEPTSREHVAHPPTKEHSLQRDRARRCGRPSPTLRSSPSSSCAGMDWA